jgi:hypothetical protein
MDVLVNPKFDLRKKSLSDIDELRTATGSENLNAVEDIFA